MDRHDHRTRAPGLPVAPQALERAVAHMRGGGLLVLPTDTVYGMGAPAADASAVARLLAVKGRGRRMPPPVLAAGSDQLDGVIAGAPPAARALMEAFWPGALTLVLDAAPGLEWDLGETGGTVAVRVPDHPLARAVLRATGPMAVTSANRTGERPATDADAARRAFPRRDVLVLDGGPTPGPVPSTSISLAGERALAPVVVRDGLLSRTALAAVLSVLADPTRLAILSHLRGAAGLAAPEGE